MRKTSREKIEVTFIQIVSLGKIIEITGQFAENFK